MIIGRDLLELKKYKGMNKNLDYAIEFILNNDLASFEVGKFNILEKEVILLREDYEPRSIENCYFESHKNYLDIQIVIIGKEGFGYAHESNVEKVITEPYNNEKDITKYLLKPELIFEMTNNSFAVVFPEDLHMPKIKLVDSMDVKKAVFKVKIY